MRRDLIFLAPAPRSKSRNLNFKPYHSGINVASTLASHRAPSYYFRHSKYGTGAIPTAALTMDNLGVVDF